MTIQLNASGGWDVIEGGRVLDDLDIDERNRRAKLAMGRIMGDAVQAMFDDEDICFALRTKAHRYGHALTLMRSYVEDMQDERLEQLKG